MSPVSGPSSTEFRDLATAVSALTFTFSEVLLESKSEQVEDDLTELGYSNDEMIDIVYVRGYSAQIDPEEFLWLVDQALDVTCLQEWSSDEFIDVALRVFEEYGRDGVHSALSRFERSQGFLRSETLVAGAIVPTSTIVSAILAIFGTTPETALLRLCLLILALILLGFTVSVILALFLVGKMLAWDS